MVSEMSGGFIENTRTVQNLREKLIQKRKELLDILAEKDDLLKNIKPKILYEYEMIFGTLEAELQEKNRIAQIYEDELLKLVSKIKRGESITNGFLSAVKRKIESRIINNKSKTETKSVGNKSKFKFNDLSNNENEIKELKLMFRKLVKFIHPDAVKGQNYFSKYWDCVLDAYTTKDFGRIIAYYNLICVGDGTDKGGLININTLRDSLIRIQRKIDFESRRLQRTLMSEPFNLREILSNENRKKEREQELKYKIAECEKSLEMSMRLLDTFKQSAGQAYEEDDDSAFQDEFIENVYFKR